MQSAIGCSKADCPEAENRPRPPRKSCVGIRVRKKGRKCGSVQNGSFPSCSSAFSFSSFLSFFFLGGAPSPCLKMASGEHGAPLICCISVAQIQLDLSSFRTTRLNYKFHTITQKYRKLDFQYASNCNVCKLKSVSYSSCGWVLPRSCTLSTDGHHSDDFRGALLPESCDKHCITILYLLQVVTATKQTKVSCCRGAAIPIQHMAGTFPIQG